MATSVSTHADDGESEPYPMVESVWSEKVQTSPKLSSRPSESSTPAPPGSTYTSIAKKRTRLT